MYSKQKVHNSWVLKKGNKEIATFTDEKDIDEILFLAEKVALIGELKKEINLEHNENSDSMFVFGWKTCAKRVDDYF